MLAKAGNSAGTERWLPDFMDAWLHNKPNTFLHACAKSGDMSRAEAWLRRIVEQGVEPNVICYNVVIHACVRGGHRDRAVQWTDRLAARGLVPTVNTFRVPRSLRGRSHVHDLRMW